MKFERGKDEDKDEEGEGGREWENSESGFLTSNFKLQTSSAKRGIDISFVLFVIVLIFLKKAGGKGRRIL